MNLSELILSTVPEEQRSKPSGVISDQLLDSLRQVESSGGKKNFNPESGAAGPYQHIPGTVKMLSTRYGKYDPYNEQQARERTKQYLESLVDYNKGDVRAALAQYGGHITKDPTGYVNSVLGGVGEQSSDLSRLILQAASETPEATEAPKEQQRPSKVAEIGRAIMRGGIFQPEVLTNVATAPAQYAREKLLGQPPQEQQATEPFIKTLGKSAAGFIDTAAGVVPAVAGGITYAGARALGQTPEQASEYQQKVISATDKPLGKAFGITEESAYKNEATTRLMNFIGENMEKGADWIAEKTGMPKQDVLSIMESGSFAVPAVAGKTVGFVKRKAGPTVSEWAQEFKRNQAGEQPAPSAGTPSGNVPNVTIVGQPGVEAPTAAPKPAAPFEVPVENPPPPAQPLSSADVASRAETLRKVGIETARKSALENNPKEASAQFITSQASQEPYGQGITEQINHEKTALDTHFNKIEQEAGGTTVRYGTPEEVGDRISAGKKIKEGLEAGQKEWKAEADRLYNEASEAHGDKPINTENFSNYLNEDSNFAYENEAGLQRGIKGYLKKKGLLNEDGSVRPMTVAEAEGVRKYINSKFHHETKGLARELKTNLDQDVFGSVGGETYEKARRHWQKGVETYDNPKGVGDLLSDEGVNQKIADEKVMDKVSSLNQSQFDHLLDTLRNDKQTAAVQQIQTSLVNQIRRAGQSAVNQPWNSVKAAKEAAALGKKLESAFVDNPKALQQIYDGINAGNIIHIPTNYPGAAVQTHLLKNKFFEMGVQKLGTGAGATIGSIFGPVGAAAGGLGGEALGANVAGRMRGSRQIKQIKQELTPLSEVGKQ